MLWPTMPTYPWKADRWVTLRVDYALANLSTVVVATVVGDETRYHAA